jgi:lysophospholipid acyltransferase (LPLAT)-like uncharacterized protein
LLKKTFRYLALHFLPFIASLLIRLLYLTNKKKFHSPQSISEEPIIFACWHGELLMLSYLYTHYRKKVHAKVLISNHFDGELIARTIKHFGFGALAGSTTRNAARVLIQAIKTIKEGYDVGITPDGPKGPRHEVADGVMAIAQKTGAKIILVEIKPTKYWQIDSWDKFIIPKPFGTINFYSTSEIDVGSMQIEEARNLIKEGLNRHEQ